MSVAAGQTNVGTSPTEIVGGDVYGKSVAIRNRGATAVFLGGSDVTTNTGFQLDAGESVGIPLADGDVVYGRVASGTEEVHYLVAGAD